MNRLFISGVLSDSANTDELVAMLSERGFQTCCAPADPGRQSWAQEIGDRISECDVFIVVLSDAWLESEQCMRQLRAADAMRKTVLILSVKPVGHNLPSDLVGRQVLDRAELLEALDALLLPTMTILGPEPLSPEPQEHHHRTREPAQSWEPGRPAPPPAAETQLSGTVFAPATVEPNAQFLVQVFAHLPEHAEMVAAQAGEFDADTHRLATVMLQSPVLAGEQLAFQLLMPGLVVDPPVQTMVWVRSPQAVQFGVTVPADISAGGVIGTVIVSRDSVPIGQLKFKVNVDRSGSAGAVASPKVAEGLHRYRRAFISYSSIDRVEVLKRTQMLAEVGIEFFQDILTLEPGDFWETAIYQEIDRCDVFLLFWSTSAKASEWVAKEWRYALNRHGGNEAASPQILPVIIEGPPPVTPPPELRSLHFNDPIIYLIKGSSPAPAAANRD